MWVFIFGASDSEAMRDDFSGRSETNFRSAQIAELQKNQKNNFKNALAAGLYFTAAKPVKEMTGKIISKFAKKLENKIKFRSHLLLTSRRETQKRSSTN